MYLQLQHLGSDIAWFKVRWSKYFNPQLTNELNFQDGILAYISICPCSFFSLFGNKLKSLRLHKHQFAPFEIYDDDALDNFIRGLITQPSQEMDSSFDKEVIFKMAFRNNFDFLLYLIDNIPYHHSMSIFSDYAALVPRQYIK